MKPKRRSLLNTTFLLFLVVFCMLTGYACLDKQGQTNRFDGFIDGHYTATVLSIPIEKEKTYRIDLLVDAATVGSELYHIDTKTIAYIQKSEQVAVLLPGQRLAFQGMLNPPGGALNPEAFDYRAHLEQKDIFATAYIKTTQWQLLDDTHYTLRIWAARAQHYIIQLFIEAEFKDRELALLSALTVGYKKMIDQDHRSEYVASGATHILAVSGLHVGIIFALLCKLFRLGRSKGQKIHWTSSLLIIIILWGFAFITGLSPSVTRATLMFSIMSFSIMGGQQNNIFNTIFISALILLLLDARLLFDLGFQLSYCAVLSIVALQPIISTFLIEKWHIPKYLSELVGVSIAAQLGTAPICIHHFNCFPLYFMLTNIWIIPLVGLIIYGAVIFILVAAPGLPHVWISYPLKWALRIMNEGVSLTSRLPHSLIYPLYIEMLTVTLLYATLLLLYYAHSYHSKRALFASLFVLMLIPTYNIYNVYKEKSKQQFFIFHDREYFNLCVQDGLQTYIVAEDGLATPDYFIHHHLARSSSWSQYDKSSFTYNTIAKHRDFIMMPHQLMACYSYSLSLYNGLSSIETLIIDKVEPENIYQFYEQLRFENLIIFRQPEKHINYYKAFCERNSVELHYIKEEGAYISEL